MLRRVGILVALLALCGVAVAAWGLPGPTPSEPTDEPTRQPRVRASTPPAPLAGKLVVIDPGHQLGNARHPRQINRLVPAGGGRKKACNTTGTATNSGYPEATLVWEVAKQVRTRLVAKGARVVFTRSSNSRSKWGPCVDVRGRAGNTSRADLKVSIHADGSAPRGRGFHVIIPGRTHPQYAASRRAALDLRAAMRDSFPYATYLAGGDGLDSRTDLATLNLSRRPVVMVEMGNMRNPTEAARMKTARGRTSYARAIAKGITAHLE